MAFHNDTGKKGEQLAADWLKARSYEILHQNWRSGRLEVDIIAQKAGYLHFIEVKCRNGKRFGNPEESVDRKKIKHMLDAAEDYLNMYPTRHRLQFDVLAVSISKNDVEFFLIEDVYL